MFFHEDADGLAGLHVWHLLFELFLEDCHVYVAEFSQFVSFHAFFGEFLFDFRDFQRIGAFQDVSEFFFDLFRRNACVQLPNGFFYLGFFIFRQVWFTINYVNKILLNNLVRGVG